MTYPLFPGLLEAGICLYFVGTCKPACFMRSAHASLLSDHEQLGRHACAAQVQQPADHANAYAKLPGVACFNQAYASRHMCCNTIYAAAVQFCHVQNRAGQILLIVLRRETGSRPSADCQEFNELDEPLAYRGCHWAACPSGSASDSSHSRLGSTSGGVLSCLPSFLCLPAVSSHPL